MLPSHNCIWLTYRFSLQEIYRVVLHFRSTKSPILLQVMCATYVGKAQR
jgi:hypothetical protein